MEKKEKQVKIAEKKSLVDEIKNVPTASQVPVIISREEKKEARKTKKKRN